MTEATIVDNRDLREVVSWQEARIEALVNRVRELEALQSESDKPVVDSGKESQS